MSIPDILNGLKLDSWYKAFVYAGILGSAVSLAIDVRGITNEQLLLISGGIFFIGSGEWMNHKHEIISKPPNAYTGPSALLEVQVRQLTLRGVFFWGLGLFLLVTGIASIVYSSFAPVPVPTPAVSSTPPPVP